MTTQSRLNAALISRVYGFALLLGACIQAGAADFMIAKEQTLRDADITTHEISSGNVVLGISELGGGYINKLYIPGIGDLIGKQAAWYGRGGQVDIRDELHGRRYNPTQAGFSDTAGTICKIRQLSSDVLVIPPRPAALFNGDGKYDFTEWENLAKDPNPNDNGNSDSDGIDESRLSGKQATEITSEFDFTERYKDVQDGKKITIPAFRLRYEFRFVRSPGHAIKQFGNGTPVYTPSAEVSDRSNLAPPGKHPSTDDSLTGLILTTTLRGDKEIWDPSVIFFVDRAGKLTTHRSVKGSRQPIIEDANPTNYPLIIISTNADPSRGPALGFYHPYDHINQYSIVGKLEKDGSIAYEDTRVTSGQLLGDLSRTPLMWLFGVKTVHLGLLNRRETPVGVYEALRGESYILVGTPNEIYAAARAIDGMGSTP